MKKDDYEVEFEEHRKEIQLDDGFEELPSRTEIHKQKGRKKKNSRTKLINIILAIFTLIPILILIYVLSDLYAPNIPKQVPVERSQVSVQKGTAAANKGAAEESQQPKTEVKEEQPNPPVTDRSETKETDAAKASPSSPQKPPEKPAPKKAESQPKPAENKQKKPIEKKPAEKKQETAKPIKEKPAKQPPAEKKPAAGARHHVVAPNETLYRISVNYYGSGAYVSKIQQANGLSSNEIRVGQTLVIP